MSKIGFQTYLHNLGACKGPVDWVGDKTLLDAWTLCKAPQWFMWLCGRHADMPTWPAKRAIEATLIKCIRRGVRISRRMIGATETRHLIDMLDWFDESRIHGDQKAWVWMVQQQMKYKNVPCALPILRLCRVVHHTDNLAEYANAVYNAVQVSGEYFVWNPKKTVKIIKKHLVPGELDLG